MLQVVSDEGFVLGSSVVRVTRRTVYIKHLKVLFYSSMTTRVNYMEDLDLLIANHTYGHILSDKNSVRCLPFI